MPRRHNAQRLRTKRTANNERIMREAAPPRHARKQKMPPDALLRALPSWQDAAGPNWSSIAARWTTDMPSYPSSPHVRDGDFRPGNPYNCPCQAGDRQQFSRDHRGQHPRHPAEVAVRVWCLDPSPALRGVTMSARSEEA